MDSSFKLGGITDWCIHSSENQFLESLKTQNIATILLYSSSALYPKYSTSYVLDT